MRDANRYHEDSLKIYKKDQPSIDEIMENLRILNNEP